VIGIGAGAGCDAQVLVWQDLMGLSPEPGAKFVKRYFDLYGAMRDAVRQWGDEVAAGTYPDEALHTYH
jgi:3-methyl-2-oxobutanoate hydroxymethyltransferase